MGTQTTKKRRHTKSKTHSCARRPTSIKQINRDEDWDCDWAFGLGLELDWDLKLTILYLCASGAMAEGVAKACRVPTILYLCASGGTAEGVAKASRVLTILCLCASGATAEGVVKARRRLTILYLPSQSPIEAPILITIALQITIRFFCVFGSLCASGAPAGVGDWD